MRLPECSHVWRCAKMRLILPLPEGSGEMLQESRFAGAVGSDDEDLLADFEFDR